jgi:hypothetical protein
VSDDELQHHIDAAVAVIRDFADEHGKAPNFKEYKAVCKGRSHGPNWFYQFGVSYNDLVRRSGATINRSGPRFGAASLSERRSAEAETSRYIDNARQRQIRRSPWTTEWPLTTVPSSARQEVHEVPQPDGTVLRITRTIASLR